jgi:hypothetical protein
MDAPGLTCAHVSSVVRVAKQFRTELVSALAPLCYDLKTNAATITSELDEWERLCTKKTLS